MGTKPYLSHTLLMNLCKSMLESFSFRPIALDLLPFKCSYVMADCSFSLALCTENKCFSTIYYVLVGCENLGIPLSDAGKSMIKKKPEGHLLIIKLLLSLWLLYKNYHKWPISYIDSYLKAVRMIAEISCVFTVVIKPLLQPEVANNI